LEATTTHGVGFDIPEWLRLVPVDFRAGGTWRDRLPDASFDPHQVAVVVSTCVSMYLSTEGIAATLHKIATLAPGLDPGHGVPAPTRTPRGERADWAPVRRARCSCIRDTVPSFFSPTEILQLARSSGFKSARQASARMLNERKFADTSDGLRTTNGEEILVANT
jgi:O-methyltransferase involved in polyketide biosynthesis